MIDVIWISAVIGNIIFSVLRKNWELTAAWAVAAIAIYINILGKQ